MLEQVRGMLRRYDMLCAGDRVTCAVSGGADSVALLWAMYLLRDSLGIELHAAHFNHGLRGAESDGDEAFVRSFCDRFDIPLSVGRGQVVAGAKGLEAAARDARYAFFDTLEGKIATAHTADDNAETVLMHMVRGTGLKGLGGINPVRGRIIRPMLTVTRQQVVDFLEEYHLAFVEDSSNATDAFLRNRLRHHVMPLLRQENPRIAQTVSDMALRLREDEAALHKAWDDRAGIPVDDFLALPEGMQNRRAAAFLKQAGVKEPDASHVDAVKALAVSHKPSARANFPSGITVCRRYGKIEVAKKDTLPSPVILTCPGITEYGDKRILCEYGQSGRDVVYPVGQITLRSRLPGDEITLPGGTKTLKKLFIDRKIPADVRPFITVVADSLGVLAVEGIGINHSRMQGETTGIRITFL